MIIVIVQYILSCCVEMSLYAPFIYVFRCMLVLILILGILVILI